MKDAPLIYIFGLGAILRSILKKTHCFFYKCFRINRCNISFKSGIFTIVHLKVINNNDHD